VVVELWTGVVTSSVVFTSSRITVDCLVFSGEDGSSVVSLASVGISDSSCGCVVNTSFVMLEPFSDIVVFSIPGIEGTTVLIFCFFEAFLVGIVEVLFLGFFLKATFKQDFRPQQRMMFLSLCLNCPICCRSK